MEVVGHDRGGRAGRRYFKGTELRISLESIDYRSHTRGLSGRVEETEMRLRNSIKNSSIVGSCRSRRSDKWTNGPWLVDNIMCSNDLPSVDGLWQLEIDQSWSEKQR